MLYSVLAGFGLCVVVQVLFKGGPRLLLDVAKTMFILFIGFVLLGLILPLLCANVLVSIRAPTCYFDVDYIEPAWPCQEHSAQEGANSELFVSALSTLYTVVATAAAGLFFLLWRRAAIH